MRPDLNVHLVELDERSRQFMRTVIREAGLQNITVHTKRIEDAMDDFTPDFVTAVLRLRWINCLVYVFGTAVTVI